MGLILDLAVVALAMVVIGSLSLLAGTLGVSAVRAVGRERATIAEARRTVVESEARLVAAAGRADAILAAIARRTTPTRPRPTARTAPMPGDERNA